MKYNSERLRSIRSRNSYSHRITKEKKYSLSEENIKKICDYLENPTKIGLWTLKATIKQKEGISKYVKDNLTEIFENQDEIEITSGKRKIKLNFKKTDKEMMLKNTGRFTFIFRLFSYIYFLESEDESLISYLESEDSEDKLIFDIIDLDKLKEEYKSAFEYFKENIFFKGFKSLVSDGYLISIKEGFFIFEDDPLYDKYYRGEEEFKETKVRRILLTSLELSTLEKLKIFYEKVGKISETELVPIFSPEEEVFKPYFKLLEQAYDSFIDNYNIQRLFRKSIDEYNEDNFSHCISTIGLITEDYLVQIFETLFRDICPKGLTLGQLYDSIHNNLKQKFEEKKIEEPKIKPLYDSVNKLVVEEKDDSYKVKETLKVFRELLNFIKENKKCTDLMMESIQKKRKRISIFTPILRSNINELIKNRNAISHRSRIPIGDYEALRTVYCCITLIIWWNKQKKLIDWKKEPDDIIKEIIERNGQKTLLQFSPQD